MPENPHANTSPAAIWKLTWPQMLTMYVMCFSGFVMVWTGGRISADVQAAMGMISQCTFFLMILSLAISNGGMASVSQSLGAGRDMRARRYVVTTLAGTTLVGLAASLLGWMFDESLLRLVRVPERILPLTEELWSVVMLFLPAQYLYAAGSVMFRAQRQVMAPLWIAVIMCACTVLGCLGFGLGMFGLPAFGALGIVGTQCGCQLLGAVCNLVVLGRSGSISRAAVPDIRWLQAGLPYLVGVALPAAGSQLVWQAGYLMLFSLVASLPAGGVEALAGLTAGLRVESLLFMPGMAFNMTASVVVGNCLGAGDIPRARRVALILMGSAAGGISVVAAGLWFLRPELAALLSHDPGAQKEIVHYLTYNLLSTPFSVISTVLAGVMTGAGAMRYNLLVFGGALWGIRLPLGWLLGHRLWGTASGVFCAMLASQCVQAMVMLYVLLRVDWPRFAMRAQKK